MARYAVTLPPDLAPALQGQLSRAFAQISADMAGPPNLTIATLPRDGSFRHAIVTDAATCPQLAFFDPTAGAWRYAADLSLVP